MQGLLNLAYQNDVTLTINKATRVTRKIASALDDSITKHLPDRFLKPKSFRFGLLKCFPVFFFILSIQLLKSVTPYIYRRFVTSEIDVSFNLSLSKHWQKKKKNVWCKTTNVKYAAFKFFLSNKKNKTDMQRFERANGSKFKLIHLNKNLDKNTINYKKK